MSADNITKRCLPGGMWDNYTNYNECLDHQLSQPPGGDPEREWDIFIFLLGYTVSIISLLLAISIFLYFRLETFIWIYHMSLLYISKCWQGDEMPAPQDTSAVIPESSHGKPRLGHHLCSPGNISISLAQSLQFCKNPISS